MNNYFLRIFSIAIVLLCLVSAVQAANVEFENNTLFVKDVDDSVGLGAFNVVLEYSNNISINSVEGESGFLVVSNIQNGDFQTFIVGISTEGLTGDIPVATVISTGTGDIDVSVRELANVQGYPISYTNEEFSGTVPGSSSNGEIIISEPQVSQTVVSTPEPSVTAMFEVPQTEGAVVGETPDYASDIEEMPENDILTSENGNESESKPNNDSPTPTQSPLPIAAILISIASTYIFKKET